MPVRQIKVPKVVWERAKQKQRRLKKKGINRGLWELIHDEEGPDMFGGLRL